MFATEHVAREYDLEVDVATADWYDAVNPRTGTKYEVKSTHRRLGNGSLGRYRLWEDQHVSLLAADRSGTAWYAFVLLEDDGTVAGVQRCKPSTVTGIVQRKGAGWNLAGHSEREGRQHKIPWTQVPFDE